MKKHPIQLEVSKNGIKATMWNHYKMTMLKSQKHFVYVTHSDYIIIRILINN